MSITLYRSNTTVQNEFLTLLVKDYVATVTVEELRGVISLLAPITDKLSMFSNYQEGLDYSGFYSPVFAKWLDKQTDALVKTSKDYSKNQYRKIKRSLIRSEEMFLLNLEMVDSRGCLDKPKAYRDTVVLFELITEFIVNYSKLREEFEAKATNAEVFDRITHFLVSFMIVSNMGKKDNEQLETYIIALLSNLNNRSYDVVYEIEKGATN